jgi:hypothetical protein
MECPGKSMSPMVLDSIYRALKNTVAIFFDGSDPFPALPYFLILHLESRLFGETPHHVILSREWGTILTIPAPVLVAHAHAASWKLTFFALANSHINTN